jgi:hypothetical protein
MHKDIYLNFHRLHSPLSSILASNHLFVFHFCSFWIYSYLNTTLPLERGVVCLLEHFILTSPRNNTWDHVSRQQGLETYSPLGNLGSPCFLYYGCFYFRGMAISTVNVPELLSFEMHPTSTNVGTRWERPLAPRHIRYSTRKLALVFVLFLSFWRTNWAASLA